jgi:hypothetical protein
MTVTNCIGIVRNNVSGCRVFVGRLIVGEGGITLKFEPTEAEPIGRFSSVEGLESLPRAAINCARVEADRQNALDPDGPDWDIADIRPDGSVAILPR